jgi:hypothetical protein
MLEAAVRWVIILLVIVFDPLAIALVLAANASKEWDKENFDKDEPKYEPDDGPLTEEQIEQIKQSVNDIEVTAEEEEAFKNLEPKGSDPTINCHKCGTELIDAPGIGLFCPNKNCDVKDGPFEESVLGQHPYLSKPFVHFDTKPLVYKPELTTDTDTKIEDATIMEVKQDLPFTELPGGYVAYDGKHMQRDALFSQHPEFLKLSADASKPVTSSFGSKFPESSGKGDIFTRVDVLPNKVFKYDGNNWIEINKETSNTYLYNTKYLEYLVEMIAKGEYDPELLSDNERVQIEDHIKLNKLNQSH